jgi:hypothetical protein
MTRLYYFALLGSLRVPLRVTRVIYLSTSGLLGLLGLLGIIYWRGRVYYCKLRSQYITVLLNPEWHLMHPNVRIMGV